MKLEIVKVGYLETNCYILKKDEKVLVIDPGDEIEKINKVIGGSKVVGVLVTHNHFDHIGALSNFNKELIYDYSNLEEKEYNIDSFKFKVIYTPGHSKDSISYYFEEDKKLFCGDFVFYENIGRCDLPTGNFSVMKVSINKIKKYPKDITIYPGHGECSTLEHEVNNNIYFKEV